MEEEEAQIEFNEGQEVEVAGESNNSNSWYSAKVIATFNGGQCKNMKKLLIEYESLIKFTKGLITPFRKIVDVTRVRPRPPGNSETFYHLNQVVDVFFAKGWWKGKITEVVKSEELGYRVLLDSPTLTNQSMLVKGDDLRIHQDWAFGYWKQDLGTKCDGGHLKTIDLTVTQVGSSNTAASSHETHSRKRKIEQLTPQTDISSLSLRNKSKSGDVLKKADQAQTQVGNTKSIATSHESYCMKHRIEKSTPQRDTSFISPLNMSKDGKESEVSRFLLPEMTESSTIAIQGPEALPSDNEKCHHMAGTISGLSDTSNGHHSLYVCQKKNKLHETDSFSIPPEGLSDQPVPNICLDTVRGVLDGESSVSDPEAADLSLLPQFRTAEKEICDSSKTEVQHSQKNLNLLPVMQSMNIFCDDQQIEGVGKQTATISDRTEGESKEIVPDASVEGVSPENQLASNSNTSINFREVSLKGHEVCNSFELAKCSMSLEGQTNNGDQCYMNLEDRDHENVMVAPYCDEVTFLNRNGEHETGMHGEVNPENRSREHETVMHDEVSPENRNNVVFTKRYSLWEDVKEMEAIQLLPEQPHFQPLMETNVLLREGKAIGYMLSFTDVVKETSKATLDEPKSTFESMLQALSDLEAFGFDVQQVRDRLEELLRLKENQLQVHDMVKHCERQIIKEKHEDELLRSEISNLDQTLLEINKRREVVELEHNMRSSSIATLEQQLQDLMETVQGIRKTASRFDGNSSGN